MKTSESKYCQCLYFTTNALARKVEKMAMEAWKPVNLSPSHAYLLLIVLADPGIQPGSIADELQLTPSTISRLVEKLEEKKLVVRVTEGKITNVYPTPAAKNLLPKMLLCRDAFYANYSSILGCEKSSTVVKAMWELADKLT
jgi:DNA-binding MarR family transcriptional regulator